MKCNTNNFRSKEEWGDHLIAPLYNHRYLQTARNAIEPIHRAKGWILKNKTWAPWFFNMRPLGSTPRTYYDACTSVAEMIITDNLCSDRRIEFLIGVEMAGVPMVGGVSRAMFDMGYQIKMGYTRPLPKKVRTPAECAALLAEIDATVTDYSDKQYVEARLTEAFRYAILDDMATDIGSKIIGRTILLWQAKLASLDIECLNVFYLLNRNRGAAEKGIADFAANTDPGLYPAELRVNYVMEFDDHLPKLEGTMSKCEYSAIREFQDEPAKFQGSEGENNRQRLLSLMNA